MKRLPKMTKGVKKQLTAQGICWKCGEKTIKKKGSVLCCSNCGLTIVKY